jgi:SAM-dependent methyltransferase
MASEGHLGGFVIADQDHPVGDRGTYERRIWSYVFPVLRIGSVLDVGCGQGFAVEYLAGRGYRVLGIDGSNLAKELNRRPDLFLQHDFVTGPCAIQSSPFDAIWCCEVVEHVAERYLPHVLDTFRSSGARYLFMTHAYPGQKGYHHVNCQGPEYWIRHLNRVGFAHKPLLTRFTRQFAKGFFRRGLVFKNSR